MYNVRCSCCECMFYDIHRYLWFETEVIARLDALPIETEREIYAPYHFFSYRIIA